MACGFCQTKHERALVEIILDDGRVVNRLAELCTGLGVWLVKFNPMVDSRSGTLPILPQDVKIVKRESIPESPKVENENN